MRVEDFTDAMGKQADSDAVKILLLRLGIKQKVILKRSETDTYMNNTNSGVSLLFESENYVSSKYDINFPSDAPVLTAIFLYGFGDNEFSEYKGELPGGLLFSDGRESAIQKLGNSAKFNSDRGSEFWEFPGNLRFFVRYSEDMKSIERVQFGVLWR